MDVFKYCLFIPNMTPIREYDLNDAWTRSTYGVNKKNITYYILYSLAVL